MGAVTRSYIFRAYVFGISRDGWMSVLDPDRAVGKVPLPWRRWATVRPVEPMKWPRGKR